MRISLKSVLAMTAVLILGAAVAQAQWTWTPQTGRWVNLKKLPKETPELQVEYARSLMLEGELGKAMRETEKFDKFYKDSPLAPENQFVRGEIRMREGKLTSAAKDFQQLLSAYPQSDKYNEAIAKQYEIADSLYDKGQKQIHKVWNLFRKRPMRRASEVYSMVVENQPFTATAAEAQYKIGLCHYACKEYVEAAYEYRRVVEDYSGSDWVDEASYGLVQCYYAAALPPKYDQTPSELAIESIDTFLAKYPSDERGADCKEKRAEMRDRVAEQRLSIAKFYEKRRDFDSARIYYQAIVDGYSDTKVNDEAKGWLDAHPVLISEGRQAFNAATGK